MSGGTSLASVAFSFVDFAAARGLSTERLLEISGLTDTHRADPDARVPDVVLVRLWFELIPALPAVVIPIELVRHARVIPIGILRHIVMHAGTVGEAIVLGNRYSRLCDTCFHSERCLRADGIIGLVARHRPEVEAMGLPMECMIGFAFRSLGEAMGAPIPLKEVTFAHAARYPVSAYETFFAAPVRFAESVNALWVDPAVLEQPLPAPDSALRGWLESQANRMLDAIPHDHPLRSRLHDAIAGELADGAELPRVAKKLAMSSRTLQRRLGELGTSFQEHLDGVRAEAAKRLLRDSSRSIIEVAFELGYADLPSFYRAFKRWTGFAPAEWRHGRS